MFGMCRFLDGVLSLQDLVDTFHRGQTLGDVIARLRELFQRLDDAVEDHHVVDERRTCDGLVVQYEDASEPQHDDDHQCA